MSSVTAPVSVLIAGELNLDLILHDYSAFPSLGREVIVDECLMTLGSASAITAVGLSRLGVPVRFVGKIGEDSWGDQCLEEMRAAGVDTSFVSRTRELQTGITVSISSAADRALVTFPGAIAELRAEEIPDEAWKDVGHLHISSYYLQRCLQPAIPDLLRQARERDMTSSLDPGGDPTGQWQSGVREAIALVDLFFPNEVELEGIGAGSDSVQNLIELQALAEGVNVFATLGPLGCLTVTKEGIESVPAPTVTVLDPTGAGDSFNAGFLAAWLRRRTLVECMRDGVCCGALATRGLGGTATQPNERELLSFRIANFRDAP